MQDGLIQYDRERALHHLTLAHNVVVKQRDIEGTRDGCTHLVYSAGLNTLPRTGHSFYFPLRHLRPRPIGAIDRNQAAPPKRL